MNSAALNKFLILKTWLINVGNDKFALLNRQVEADDDDFGGDVASYEISYGLSIGDEDVKVKRHIFVWEDDDFGIDRCGSI